jgi:hypothetical protein
MKTFSVRSFATTCALLCLLNNARAIPYTLGMWSVNANSNDFSLALQTEINPNLAGTTFSLADGQSFSVDFFRIWTDELTLDTGNRRPENIIANIVFMGLTAPRAMTGITNGSNSGGALFAQVDWDNVQGNFILSDRTFPVSLEDIPRFNEGEGVFTRGKDNGATVRATITQHTGGPSAVPDTGSTALVLVLGFVALAFAARGRLEASAP